MPGMVAMVRGLRRALPAALLLVVAVAVSGCAITDYERLYGYWTADNGRVSIALERSGNFVIHGARVLLPADFAGDPSRLEGRYSVDTEMDLSDPALDAPAGRLRLNVQRIGDFSLPRAIRTIEAETPGATEGFANVINVDLVGGADGHLILASERLFGDVTDFERTFRIDEILGTDLPVFIGLTIVLFGGAAFLTGQALAGGWKGPWIGIFYCALMAFSDQFLVYGLFDGDGTRISGFVLDWIYLSAVFLFAYRLTQARKMVTQYPWLYVRSGLFGWRKRAPTG